MRVNLVDARPQEGLEAITEQLSSSWLIVHLRHGSLMEQAAKQEESLVLFFFCCCFFLQWRVMTAQNAFAGIVDNWLVLSRKTGPLRRREFQIDQTARWNPNDARFALRPPQATVNAPQANMQFVY